ncbi:hypothetical protein [Agrococcus sp. DT81.2]|uniref:hypothetical protein n=1 Tax=Agrococcus sp. DT81.2 TaxID=3393414 RepID=UPI003CE46110
MQVTTAQFVAAAEALGLNPDTTLSFNLSPYLLRVVHTDQAVTTTPVEDSA